MVITVETLCKISEVDAPFKNNSIKERQIIVHLHFMQSSFGVTKETQVLVSIGP